jgi:hypothetical protein
MGCVKFAHIGNLMKVLKILFDWFLICLPRWREKNSQLDVKSDQDVTDVSETETSDINKTHNGIGTYTFSSFSGPFNSGGGGGGC